MTRSEAVEWELVLQSRHLPCRMRRIANGWSIQVQPWFLDRARGEVLLYREENQPVPEPLVLPSPRPGELWPTVAILLVMLAFFGWYSTPHPGLNLYASRWLAAGSAEAAAILDGQWWRLITALTLHANGPHVVGNAVIGGAFIVLACRVLGNGLAWLLVMASGAVGNFFNALILGPPHNSIGFSTAVFGAAGVLSGVRMAEGRGGRFKRAIIPVGAGLGILAMLGAGGKNTDLGAHLFGVAAGLGFGFAGGVWAVKRGKPSNLAGAIMLTIALALPVMAWWVAFW